jgi:hypothetical protein
MKVGSECLRLYMLVILLTAPRTHIKAPARAAAAQDRKGLRRETAQGEEGGQEGTAHTLLDTTTDAKYRRTPNGARR